MKILCCCCFLKNGPIPASFLFYFCSFLITISIQIEKSIDGVLGIQTQGSRMVGTDETMELWWPPNFVVVVDFLTHILFISISAFVINSSPSLCALVIHYIIILLYLVFCALFISLHFLFLSLPWCLVSLHLPFFLLSSFSHCNFNNTN